MEPYDDFLTRTREAIAEWARFVDTRNGCADSDQRLVQILSELDVLIQVQETRHRPAQND